MVLPITRANYWLNGEEKHWCVNPQPTLTAYLTRRAGDESIGGVSCSSLQRDPEHSYWPAELIRWAILTSSYGAAPV